jgi:hypothetical protein
VRSAIEHVLSNNKCSDDERRNSRCATLYSSRWSCTGDTVRSFRTCSWLSVYWTVLHLLIALQCLTSATWSHALSALCSNSHSFFFMFFSANSFPKPKLRNARTCFPLRCSCNSHETSNRDEQPVTTFYSFIAEYRQQQNCVFVTAQYWQCSGSTVLICGHVPFVMSALLLKFKGPNFALEWFALLPVVWTSRV